MFVRISRPFVQCEQLIEHLASKSDKLVVYEHSEDVSRVHIHFYAVCSVKSDTIRNYIRKLLGCSKTDFSIKEKDVDEKCITYMSKGKLDPVYVKGYELSDLNTLRSTWVDYQEVKRDRHVKKDQITMYDMAKEVYDILKDINVDSSEEHYMRYLDIAIAVHHKHRKAFCEYSLRKVVHCAWCMSKEGKNAFMVRAVANFFRC